MLGAAVGIEVGRVDQIVGSVAVPERQRKVAGRPTLGGAEADQQFEIVGVRAEQFPYLGDVGGLRPALACEIRSRQFSGKNQGHGDAPGRKSDLHELNAAPQEREALHAPLHRDSSAWAAGDGSVGSRSASSLSFMI